MGRKTRKKEIPFADAPTLLMRRFLGARPTGEFCEARLQEVRMRLRSDDKLPKEQIAALQVEAIGLERHPERFRPLLMEAERHLGRPWTLTPEEVEVACQALFLAAVEHEPAMQDSEELAVRIDRNRAKGPRGARTRHRQHVEDKVEPLREEFRTRLKAKMQEHPRERRTKLQPLVINEMAREHHYEKVKDLRDTIKPNSVRLTTT